MLFRSKIEAAAKKLGLDKKLSFDLQERGLVVRVVSDNVLFKSGDANLQPDGEKVLALIGEVLKSVDNPLWIEGNTDDRPVAAGSVYKSNYGLSTLRAESVLLYLAQTVGLDETRMRPTGWGSTHPISTNASEEGRAKNRRVEIVVVSKAVDAALSAGGLTDAPASATPVKPELGTIGTNLKITP